MLRSVLLLACISLSTALAGAQYGPVSIPCVDTLAISSQVILTGTIVNVGENTPKSYTGAFEFKGDQWLKGHSENTTLHIRSSVPVHALEEWQVGGDHFLVFAGRSNSELWTEYLLVDLSVPQLIYGKPNYLFTEDMKKVSDGYSVQEATEVSLRNHAHIDHVKYFKRSLPPGFISEGTPVTDVPADAHLERWAQSATTSADDGERKEAAEALGYFPSPNNATLVQRLLTDTASIKVNGTPEMHYFVRQAAYNSLLQMGVKVPTPALNSVTMGAPPMVRLTPAEQTTRTSEIVDAEDLIHLFASSHDASDLDKAFEAVKRASVENPTSPPQRDPQQIGAAKTPIDPHLVALWLKFYAALDTTETMLLRDRKLPVTKVLPPGENGKPSPYAGPVPPSQIKDPVAREQYEIAIAENERRRIAANNLSQIQGIRIRASSFFWLWATGLYKDDPKALASIAKEATIFGCSQSRADWIRAVMGGKTRNLRSSGTSDLNATANYSGTLSSR